VAALTGGDCVSGGESPHAFDAETPAFALIEHKEHTNMKPKNTICLWFDKDAHERRASTPPLFRIVK
jgi:hypothetical protein